MTAESKAREFWFEYMSDTKEYGQLSTRPPYVRDSSFELIHVIEKSYADKLQSENETLRQIKSSMSDVIDQKDRLIKAKDELLREVYQTSIGGLKWVRDHLKGMENYSIVSGAIYRIDETLKSLGEIEG